MPPELATFTETDWPGRSVADRLVLWTEARKVWHDEHGWPGGPLAMICGFSDVQRRLEGRPLLSWGRDPAELARLEGREYDPRRR